MAIKEKNLKLINELERNLKEQLIWIARDSFNLTSKSIESYRNLRQFVIGLSVAIIGIVFPIMLANEIFKNNTFFIVSLICFNSVVIYGISNLVIVTIKDLIGIPSIINSNLEETNNQIKQVQELKKIQNNEEAGKKYKELQEKYSKDCSKENLSWWKKTWRRYESLFFFGTFIVSFILLIIGFFQ